MTSEAARKILAIYRPTIDAGNPQFADALAQAECDPELARWLQEQCTIYETLRGKLKEAPVPEDLLEKTLRYRPSVVWWKHTWLQLAACLLVLASIAFYWFSRGPRAAAFENYRRTMAGVVSNYRMSLETGDPDRVRTFLANNQAPADYLLPASITRQRLLGCATLSWDGNPVSLLCFRHQSGSDLWLFVTHRKELKGGPRSSDPSFGEANEVNTAAWLQNGNVYLLATRGDPKLLRETFQ